MASCTRGATMVGYSLGSKHFFIACMNPHNRMREQGKEGSGQMAIPNADPS